MPVQVPRCAVLPRVDVLSALCSAARIQEDNCLSVKSTGGLYRRLVAAIRRALDAR